MSTADFEVTFRVGLQATGPLVFILSVYEDGVLIDSKPTTVTVVVRYLFGGGGGGELNGSH